MQQGARLVLAGFCLFALASLAYADTVYFADGSVEENVEVTAETLTKVYFKKGSIQIERTSSEVVRVEYSEWSYNYTEGRDQEGRGEYEEAAKSYEKVIKFMDSEREKVYASHARARVLRFAGKDKDAIQAYKFIIDNYAKHRTFIDAQEGIGKTYLETKQYGEAEKAFAELKKIATERKLGDHYVYLADLQMAEVKAAQGKHAEARKAFEDLWRNVPGLTTISHPAKVRAEAMRVVEGDPDGAIREIQAFQKKRIDDRTRAECALVLGDAHRAKGNHKEALKAYLRVVILYPKDGDLHPRALYFAAESFRKTDLPEKNDKAQELVTQLRTRFPNSPWAKQ